MTSDDTLPRAPRWSRLYWAGAAGLLLLPAIAMQFTREVTWTASDFAFAAVLLGGIGLAYEFLARRGGGALYRAGAAVALAAMFLLVWINGAVGIIGDEGDPANLLFAGVIAIVVGGAALSRFRASGMARAALAAAAAQVAIAALAVAAGLGAAGPIWPRDVIGASAIFVTLWLLAAWLFRAAARRQSTQSSPMSR